jgi:LacI family transcriptional regulator
MISISVRNEINRYLERLSPVDQARVVDFAKSLVALSLTGAALDSPNREAGISVWDGDEGEISLEPSDRANAFETIVAFFEPDNSFFDRFIQLLSELSEQGAFKLVSHLMTRAEARAPSSRQILQSNSRYLFVTYGFAPMARRYQQAGNRVVLLGAPNYGDVADIPCVHSDHARGGYEQAQHLLSLGHRRIGYVYKASDFRKHPRWLGFQSAIAQVSDTGEPAEGMPLYDDTVVGWRQAPDDARAYFAAADAPTALVAWNDHQAMQILETLDSTGIRVPGDVSLIGYDALPIGEKTSPPLTTIDSGVRRQLEAALALLTQDAPVAPDTQIVVPTTLIVRGSTSRRIG